MSINSLDFDDFIVYGDEIARYDMVEGTNILESTNFDIPLCYIFLLGHNFKTYRGIEPGDSKQDVFDKYGYEKILSGNIKKDVIGQIAIEKYKFCKSVIPDMQKLLFNNFVEYSGVFNNQTYNIRFCFDDDEHVIGIVYYSLLTENQYKYLCTIFALNKKFDAIQKQENKVSRKFNILIEYNNINQQDISKIRKVILDFINKYKELLSEVEETKKAFSSLHFHRLDDFLMKFKKELKQYINKLKQ